MKSDLGVGDSSPSAGSTPVDLGRYQREMRQLLHRGPDEVENAVTAIRSLLAFPEAYAAAYFRRAETHRLRPASPLICHTRFASEVRGHESRLIDAVDRMLRVEGPIVYPLGDAPFDIYVYPLGAPGNVTGAIAIFAKLHSAEVDSQLIMAAGLVAAELSQLHLTSGNLSSDPLQAPPLMAPPSTTNPAAQSAESQGLPPAHGIPHAGAAEGGQETAGVPCWDHPLTDLLAADLAAGKVDESAADICYRLANRVEQHLGVSQVMLGLADRRGRHCKLQALSGMPAFADRSPLATQTEELMSESILHDGLFAASISDVQHSLTSAEQNMLQICDAGRLFHGPLMDPMGTKIGAWIVVDSQNESSLEESLVTLQPALGGILSVVRRLRRGKFAQFMQSTFADEDIARRRRRWQIGAVLAAVLLCPVPYRVGCDAQLFPVTHRFVPAPYEGVLKEVLVESGDIVKRGQVLARMDAREIELQLAANRADLMRASKQHDSEMDRRDISASQLARLDMERLEAEQEMLQNRANKLEIRSPVDGVILGGESEKLQGARIKVGETLFETGPLDRMVAEIYVPDEDIARVEFGQKVNVRLDAFPMRTFHAEICKISPRTETHREENVFVAEVQLDNVKTLLRPGMVGRGKISTGWKPLAWNLFHKPFDQLTRIVRW